MRRVIAFILLLIVVVTPVTANAASVRTISVWPKIEFSGTTAESQLTVLADNSSDKISATVKLWDGNSCLKTWYASATGYLFFNETCSVASGKTYRLTASVTINGTVQPTATATGTCP